MNKPLPLADTVAPFLRNLARDPNIDPAFALAVKRALRDPWAEDVKHDDIETFDVPDEEYNSNPRDPR